MMDSAYFQQGREHCRAARWPAALVCLEKALAHVGEEPLLHYYLGLVHNNLGHHALAERCLRHSLALQAGNANAWMQLGLAHLGQGGTEAVVCFEQVLALEPRHIEAYFFLAQACERQGRDAEAMVAYRRAIALHPSLYQAIFNLGLVHHRRHETAAAKRCFQEVIELVPECVEAYSMLGKLACEADRPAEALPLLTTAVAKAPHSRDAWYDLGLLQHRLGNRRQGIASLGKAITVAKAGADRGGPQRIRIEVSSCCNLRCRHCPTGTSYQAVPRAIMTPALFATVIEQMRGLQTVTECVMYLGGEPLLNPHLPDMIRKVKAETSVVRVIFNTNGMLLHERACQELAGCGVDQIEVSIDGRSPAENDAIRQGADYDRIKAHIRLLQRYAPGCLISVANTVPRREGDPDTPMVPIFLQTDFPDLPIQTSYAMAWPGLTRAGSLFGRSAANWMRPPLQYCKKPFTEMVVRANGDVVLCCYDLASDKVMGNVNATQLRTLWEGGGYESLRAAVSANQVADLPDLCRRCVVYTGAIPQIAGEGW